MIKINNIKLKNKEIDELNKLFKLLWKINFYYLLTYFLIKKKMQFYAFIKYFLEFV